MKTDGVTLYIGEIIPSGWGNEYPIFRIDFVEELKDFLARFHGVKSFTVGLDLRNASPGVSDCLLKFLEDNDINIVLRMKEPVLSTILSRCRRVFKKENIELKNVLNLRISGDSGIEQKIKNLK